MLNLEWGFAPLGRIGHFYVELSVLNSGKVTAKNYNFDLEIVLHTLFNVIGEEEWPAGIVDVIDNPHHNVNINFVLKNECYAENLKFMLIVVDT